jgi:two-component system sensor kinase FixL
MTRRRNGNCNHCACDHSSNVAGRCSAITDAEAQTRLRQALEEENRRFRALFDQAPVFLILTSGPEFRLEYANRAYERLVGRRGLVGRTAEEAVPELAEQGFIDLLRQAYEGGQPLIFRDSLVKLRMQPVGQLEPRYLDFVYQPIVNGGRVTGVLVVGQDVTEQHFAEERAEALRDKLDHASRLSAMVTVASTLAHELNQPLAAIQSYAEGSRTLLASGEDAPGMLDEALKAIGDNAYRAGEVVRRLRDATVRGRVRREDFDLEDAVREAASLYKAGDRHGLSLRFDFAPGARATADRVQVQQVLLNLIRNACEACAKAGRPQVTISTCLQREWLEVRVKDKGEGIAEGALLTLFDPFMSTKPGGMGLGLSISRTIIESQGGRIWAENGPNGGAVFCFTLPTS